MLPQDRVLFSNICEQADDDLDDEISFRIQRPSDGKVRWLAIRMELFTDETTGAQKLIGVVRDVTSHKDAEARQDMLTHELVHRIKNILSSVSAIASQTFRQHDYETAKSTFSERLISLSKAHEVLTRNDWQQTTILEITQICLSHLEDDRIIVDGPEIAIPPKAVTTLALAINELATNSAKYGALSVPEGQVNLSWKTHTPEGQSFERLHWSWIESNGPKVQPPTRKGFGTFLIERALAADFSGVVHINYAPTGVCCTLDAPRPETAKSEH